MELTLVEKIKIVSSRRGVSMAELARMLGKSSQNFYQQLKRGDFRVSDLEKIAAALGYDFIYDFVEHPADESIDRI